MAREEHDLDHTFNFRTGRHKPSVWEVHWANKTRYFGSEPEAQQFAKDMSIVGERRRSTIVRPIPMPNSVGELADLLGRVYQAGARSNPE